MNTRPLLIEFIGLPAGGKTTLATALADRLTSWNGQEYIAMAREFRSLRVRGRMSLHKLADACWYGLTHPVISAWVAAYVWAAHPAQEGFRRGMVLLRAFGTIERLRRLNQNGIIMEEGVLQMAWSVIVHRWRLPARATRHLVRQLTRRYRLIVVWVQIPPPIALERFRRRGPGGGRLHKLEDTQRLEVFTRGESYLAELVDICRAESARIIQIDGQHSLEDGTGQLFKELREEGTA